MADRVIKITDGGNVSLIDTLGNVDVNPGESVFAPEHEALAADAVTAWVLGGTYGPDDIRSHVGRLWIYVGAGQSTALDPNWAPGIAWSLWWPFWDKDTVSNWRQPTGAHDAYPLDIHVLHNGKEWVSLYAANVWEPGVFGWSEVA